MGSDSFTSSGSRSKGRTLTRSGKIVKQWTVRSKSLHKLKCCALLHNASYAALGIPPRSAFTLTRRGGRNTADGLLPAHTSTQKDLRDTFLGQVELKWGGEHLKLS